MPTRPKTIAIIDDDLRIRGSIERLLTTLGYGTNAFASPAEFLSVAASCAVDCLLIDIQLGADSGLELARHAVVSALNLPIIFITASDNDALRTRALAQGVAYLRKPFTSEELRKALANAGL